MGWAVKGSIGQHGELKGAEFNLCGSGSLLLMLHTVFQSLELLDIFFFFFQMMKLIIL